MEEESRRRRRGVIHGRLDQESDFEVGQAVSPARNGRRAGGAACSTYAVSVPG
jgi:hypothetical protein